jgi:hypothetical protein
MSDFLQSVKQQVEKWPRKKGKAAYMKYLSGGSITRAEAIHAKCYECVLGEDTEPCLASRCPLQEYCQWNE